MPSQDKSILKDVTKNPNIKNEKKIKHVETIAEITTSFGKYIVIIPNKIDCIKLKQVKRAILVVKDAFF